MGPEGEVSRGVPGASRRPKLRGRPGKVRCDPGRCSCPSVCAGPANAPSCLTSYQRAFDDFLERCKQLRNYRANVMANINNCLSFR